MVDLRKRGNLSHVDRTGPLTFPQVTDPDARQRDPTQVAPSSSGIGPITSVVDTSNHSRFTPH
ncbi:MAG: hypothetical protein H0V07_07005, partial [Propionibacteriales bacterium]|nr:hypothetical protein [Propionibacteriales bacterium]